MDIFNTVVFSLFFCISAECPSRFFVKCVAAMAKKKFCHEKGGFNWTKNDGDAHTYVRLVMFYVNLMSDGLQCVLVLLFCFDMLSEMAFVMRVKDHEIRTVCLLIFCYC